jgi:hypothetical protein
MMGRERRTHHDPYSVIPLLYNTITVTV